jgi:hypothetical protein
MSVEQAAFDEVFNGAISYVPKVIVRGSLEDVAARMGFQVEQGEDGLDGFVAVPLVLKVAGVAAVPFALWRHEGNPVNSFALHFRMTQGDVGSLVDEILLALRIKENAVVWRDTDVLVAVRYV